MSKLRDSARGEQCTVRLPGVCNWDPETTILAHLGGGGMALKKDDMQAAFCCSSCHDEVDRRTCIFSAEYAELSHRQGVERTQEIWRKNGLIMLIK